MNASQWRRYVFREKYLIDRQVRDVEEPKKEGQSIKKRGVSGQRVSVTLPHYFPSSMWNLQLRSLFHGSLSRNRAQIKDGSKTSMIRVANGLEKLDHSSLSVTG